MSLDSDCLDKETIEQLLVEARNPSAAAEAATEHLASCEKCRANLRRVSTESAAKMMAFLKDDPDNTDCLVPELIVRYVRGELPAFEVDLVEMHLEDCVRCATEVESARDFHSQMEAEADEPRLFMPEAVPPTTAELEPSQTSPGSSFWKELRSIFVRPKVAWTMSGVLACSVLYLIILSNQPDKQVAELRIRLEQIERQAASLKQNNNDVREQARTADQKIAILNEKLAQADGKIQTLNQKVASSLYVASSNGPDEARGLLVRDARGRYFYAQSLPSAVERDIQHGEVSISRESRLALSDIATRREARLGPDNDNGKPFELIFPIGRIVEQPRPMLRWKPYPNATHYSVDLRDITSDIELPPGEQREPGVTTWVPPKSLSAGHEYVWQVIAYDANNTEVARSYKPPLTPARFRVLDANTAATLKRYSNSPLVLAALYAQSGMLEEAQKQLTRIPKQAPERPLAQRMEESLRIVRQNVRAQQ